MENRNKSMRKHLLRISMIIMLVTLFFEIIGVSTPAVFAEESGQTQKHLVIKVIEDEDLVDIDDEDIPLSFYSEGRAEERSGTRHIILMSVMLACAVIYVVYQGVNEKKLIELRKRAAAAQYQRMTENRK
ncbi:MAG: hypothetical protein IKG67_01885 [Parasporobacterium sp.]|nr:hypothetical protein [Parasporobacterium sp.]